jgi:hypothetical protein
MRRLGVIVSGSGLQEAAGQQHDTVRGHLAPPPRVLLTSGRDWATTCPKGPTLSECQVRLGYTTSV